MDRRHFLTLVGAAVGGIALEQAIPLGRVWSFPKEIAIAPLPIIGSGNLFLPTEWIQAETLQGLKNKFVSGELGRCFGFEFDDERTVTTFGPIPAARQARRPSSN